jgi:hypothetical protein
MVTLPCLYCEHPLFSLVYWWTYIFSAAKWRLPSRMSTLALHFLELFFYVRIVVNFTRELYCMDLVAEVITAITSICTILLS